MCCRRRCVFCIPVRNGSLASALGYIQAIISLLLFILVTAASITWIVDKNLILNNLFDLNIFKSILNESHIPICVPVGDDEHSVWMEASWWSLITMAWILLIVHGGYAVVLIKGVKNKRDALILSYFNYSVILNVILTVLITMLLIFVFLTPIRNFCLILIALSVFVIFNSLLLMMVWQTYQQTKLQHALDIVEERLYKDYMTDMDRAPPPRVLFGSRIYDEPRNFDINNGRSIGIRTIQHNMKRFYENLPQRGEESIY